MMLETSGPSRALALTSGAALASPSKKGNSAMERNSVRLQRSVLIGGSAEIILLCLVFCQWCCKSLIIQWPWICGRERVQRLCSAGRSVKRRLRRDGFTRERRTTDPRRRLHKLRRMHSLPSVRRVPGLASPSDLQAGGSTPRSLVAAVQPEQTKRTVKATMWHLPETQTRRLTSAVSLVRVV